MVTTSDHLAPDPRRHPLLLRQPVLRPSARRKRTSPGVYPSTEDDADSGAFPRAASELPPGWVRHSGLADEGEDEDGSWGRRTDVDPEVPGGIAPDRAAAYARLERLGKGSWWALGVFLVVAVAWFLLRRFGSFIVPSVIGIVLGDDAQPRRRVDGAAPRAAAARRRHHRARRRAAAGAAGLGPGGHRRRSGPSDLEHLAGGRRAHRPLAGRQRYSRRHAGPRGEGRRRFPAGRRPRTAARARRRPRPVRARRGRVPRRRVQLLLPLGGPAGAPLDLAPPHAAGGSGHAHHRQPRPHHPPVRRRALRGGRHGGGDRRRHGRRGRRERVAPDRPRRSSSATTSRTSAASSPGCSPCS